MTNTYNFLRGTITNANLMEEQNEVLVRAWKENPQDEIIAALFCKNFPVWNKIASKFSQVSDEDKESAILQHIGKALQLFDLNKTYTFTAFAGKLILKYFNWYQFNVLAYKGRQNEAKHDSIEDILASERCSSERRMALVEDSDYSQERTELDIMLSMAGLTQRELSVCKEILDNNKITLKEISENTGIGIQTVYVIRNGLRSKLAFLKA